MLRIDVFNYFQTIGNADRYLIALSDRRIPQNSPSRVTTPFIRLTHGLLQETEPELSPQPATAFPTFFPHLRFLLHQGLLPAATDPLLLPRMRKITPGPGRVNAPGAGSAVASEARSEGGAMTSNEDQGERQEVQ